MASSKGSKTSKTTKSKAAKKKKEQASSSSTTQQTLPVIIVGAGPCGLVTALCLQRYGVRFVLLEKASRETICSNAGSGFELAPTALEILEHRLGLDTTELVSPYSGLDFWTTEGKLLRQRQLPATYRGGSVNRSRLQQTLLNALFPTPAAEEGILRCGSAVKSYTEFKERGTVQCVLDSGGKIYGCALLACDGIRSKCRDVLHGRGVNHYGESIDPLHYCGAKCYWGTTPCPKGSKLHQEFQAAMQPDAAGASPALLTVATPKAPASVFLVASEQGAKLHWGFTIKAEDKKKATSDLTRRGGGVLTEDDKERLFGTNTRDQAGNVLQGAGNFSLLEELVKATPAHEITEAGLYDRENLDLAYTSDTKLVALLGDAAHPQTPFCGQGVNMAITDAYVYATSLAMALKGKGTISDESVSNGSGGSSGSKYGKNRIVRETIAWCDSAPRRTSAGSIVQQARFFCNLFVSTNPLVAWCTRLYAKHAPTSAFTKLLAKTDQSNKDYLKRLDRRYPVADQAALRQPPPGETATAAS